MSNPNIVSKCINWNTARYNQEYNYTLAVKLLLEETEEMYASDLKVEVLDAIGDITFVAIGIMWKLGIPQTVIEEFFYKVDLSTMTAGEAFNHCCYINNLFLSHVENPMEGEMPGLNFACFSAFITALGALRGMGMQSHYYDVINAICDSNDTKEIKGKSAAHIKANIVKGSAFVPPTVKLQAIVDFYNIKCKGVRQ